MKIKIGTTILNEAGEIPKNWSISTKRNIQTETMIGARNASIFDRKNSKVSISFSIERVHESEASAEIFCVQHSSKMDELDAEELVFESENFEGKVLAKFKMQDAIIDSLKISSDGLKSRADYRFNAPCIERINL